LRRNGGKIRPIPTLASNYKLLKGNWLQNPEGASASEIITGLRLDSYGLRRACGHSVEELPGGVDGFYESFTERFFSKRGRVAWTTSRILTTFKTLQMGKNRPELRFRLLLGVNSCGDRFLR
jgi:hypothetical protein